MTIQIAAQLYTIRQAFVESPVAALVRLREIGYEHAELAGLGGHSVEQVRRSLATAGVSAISMHVPLDRLAGHYRAVVDEAAALGVGHLVVPSLDEEYRHDHLDGYRRAADDLAGLAERLGSDGLTLHYHNHDFELIAVGGRTPFEVLLEASGPRVGLELDLGWIQVAGADPAAWLRRVVGRVVLAHLKDVEPRSGRAPRFRALGDGIIDWPTVLATAMAAGLAWAIVEDDDARDPFMSLDRSRRYLQTFALAA